MISGLALRELALAGTMAAVAANAAVVTINNTDINLTIYV